MVDCPPIEVSGQIRPRHSAKESTPARIVVSFTRVWTYWLNQQTYDPTLLPSELVNEWIAQRSTLHGLRGTLDTYKATLENARINEVL